MTDREAFRKLLHGAYGLTLVEAEALRDVLDELPESIHFIHIHTLPPAAV
jgi:hypothetical protein